MPCPYGDWVRFAFFGCLLLAFGDWLLAGPGLGSFRIIGAWGTRNWVRFVFLGRRMVGVGQIGFVSHFLAVGVADWVRFVESPGRNWVCFA